MPLFTVIVGNVGQVHSSSDHTNAVKDWREYKAQSKQGYGRASGENVTLCEDGEPILEYHGEMKIATRAS